MEALRKKYEKVWDELSDLKHGVWIVRHCQPNIAYYCTAIDANSGLVMDSYEKYLMQLSKASLRCCIGKVAYETHVVEAHKVDCTLSK